jgi:uncharacterized protein
LSQFYFDTSAIVKGYTQEAGSNWLKTLLDPNLGHTFILSEIALAEFAAAIAAKGRAGNISSVEQAKTLALFIGHCTVDYQLVEVSRTIIERAVNLTQNHRLRGYDAVQLATALITKETLMAANIQVDFILVAADEDLLKVGQLEGLAIENPNLRV